MLCRVAITTSSTIRRLNSLGSDSKLLFFRLSSYMTTLPACLKAAQNQLLHRSIACVRWRTNISTPSDGTFPSPEFQRRTVLLSCARHIHRLVQLTTSGNELSFVVSYSCSLDTSLFIDYNSVCSLVSVVF